MNYHLRARKKKRKTVMKMVTMKKRRKVKKKMKVKRNRVKKKTHLKRKRKSKRYESRLIFLDPIAVERTVQISDIAHFLAL